MGVKRIFLVGVILVLSATAVAALWEFKVEHLVMCELLKEKYCPGSMMDGHVSLKAGLFEKLTHVSVAFWGMILVISYPLYILRKCGKRIKVLQGLLPVCCHCKKIRNNDDKWEQMEAYITRKSEARFSHSICPECLIEHYHDFMGEKAI